MMNPLTGHSRVYRRAECEQIYVFRQVFVIHDGSELIGFGIAALATAKLIYNSGAANLAMGVVLDGIKGMVVLTGLMVLLRGFYRRCSFAMIQHEILYLYKKSDNVLERYIHANR